MNDIIYNRIYDKMLTPKRIGTYVIMHTDDNINAKRYVGSTENLFNRLNGHSINNVMYIDLCLTDNMLLAQSLERILIHILKPASNITEYELTTEDTKLMNKLLKNGFDRKFLISEVKIGYRYLNYTVGLKKRFDSGTSKVNEYQGKNKKIYRLQIPEEMGLRGGDVVKFEKIDDKEIKLIKLT